MTGRENLEMAARLFGHRGAAARAATATVIDQLSLAEVADRRAAIYSGGQRRRLDLGASLVGAPRLLLLDEPTTGLDPVSRREVWDAVRGLATSGTSVLLTTHYLDEADELADQVAVTDPGRLADAAAILARVTATEPRRDPAARRVTAAAAGGTRQLADVLGGLDAAGIAVDAAGLRRPTLDEIFLTLAGAAGDPAGPPAQAQARVSAAASVQ
jgi:ABC-2 type transport system ATP-binding protein